MQSPEDRWDLFAENTTLEHIVGAHQILETHNDCASVAQVMRESDRDSAERYALGMVTLDLFQKHHPSLDASHRQCEQWLDDMAISLCRSDDPEDFPHPEEYT